eukprot:COSAG02_NODE_430_length_22462_cov_52.755042_9_plen_666_part_00
MCILPYRKSHCDDQGKARAVPLSEMATAPTSAPSSRPAQLPPPRMLLLVVVGVLVAGVRPAVGWRCSGCPADPTCKGRCPKCDSLCVHGSCVHDQCACAEGFATRGHGCVTCASGTTGTYPNCSGNPPAPPGPPGPAPSWLPRYDATGVYTNSLWKSAESTPFRFNGRMYVMESVEGDGNFFNKTTQGGSYFRITDLTTGIVLRNVSESIGHAFFSAVVDDERGVVWVFGAAHHRGWDNLGPCDDNSKTGGSPAKGCYVGAWKSSDLTNWSKTFKTVTFPDGNYTQNNDVTWVRPSYFDWEARHGRALPRHQAAMALEAEGGNFGVAINIGTDGDLSRAAEWKIVSSVQRMPEHACPAFRYDPMHGDYYLTGGGETQEGPYRSKDLRSWTKSPLSPLTQNSVTLANAYMRSLADRDGKISPFYKEKWAELSPAETDLQKLFLANISKWSWGHSDFDWCCDDNKAPTYLLYMVTQQGHPDGWNSHTQGSWFQAMGMANTTIIDWLRGYFPEAPLPGPTPPGPSPRQWTTQDNFNYIADRSWNKPGAGPFPLLGAVKTVTACQTLCAAVSSCHAYTYLLQPIVAIKSISLLVIGPKLCTHSQVQLHGSQVHWPYGRSLHCNTSKSVLFRSRSCGHASTTTRYRATVCLSSATLHPRSMWRRQATVQL